MSDINLTAQDGVLSDAKAAGKGQEGIVRRWMLEIDLADKLEKDWRKTANQARDIYRGKKKSQNSFNILWANTEVIRPNLYNSTPKPDVRRRYRDADPQGKEISEVLERSLSFEADSCDFDGVMEAAVFDAALPGRGTARICFEPYYEEKTDPTTGETVNTLAGAKVYPERVAWDMFRRGPGSCWEEVPWIAYLHQLTMDEVKNKFPAYANKVQYDVVIGGADEKKANAEPEVFKRVNVWEILNKEDKQTLWIAPSYAESPLLIEEDKLKLKDFFDMPKPIYSVDDTSSLEPICEYSLYEEQAKELNRVTQRINKLTESLKVRGVYDATLAELSTLMNSDDNDMIPTSDSTIALQAGGFDKAIWMMPLEQIAKVLGQLYIQREQIKMTIYEVIGISDILRGQSDPSETLGAQELKAQSGSVRLQRRQREVQRFVRDVFRIMSEIISEHYPAELLTIMTGVQVTPEMQQIMQRDLLRGIHVDVETDSTIAADQAKTRKDMAEVMEAVGGFVTNFGPAVQSGAVSMDAAKKILISIIRKARLGRDVEDAIEQDAQQPVQQQPDPEAMKAQAEQQAMQAELQMKQEQMQADQQMAAQKMQLDAEKMQADHQLKVQQMQMDYELKIEQMHLDAQLRKEESQAKIEAEGQARVEERDHEVAVNKMLKPEDYEDEMKEVAEAMKLVADQMASANAVNQSVAQNSLTAMTQLAQVMQTVADSMSGTRTIKTPDGRTYTATLQ